MRKPTFHLPSPAMVVALIALVIALGGTGYAASRLPGPSAGAAKAKKKPTSSSKALSAKQVEALIARYVKSHHSELAGPQGSAGPMGGMGAQGSAGGPGTSGGIGATGATGPTGASGSTKAIVRVHEVIIPKESSAEVKASCEPGEVATGGGVDLTEGNSRETFSGEPGGTPFGNPPTAWRSVIFNAKTVESEHLRVDVVCVSP